MSMKIGEKAFKERIGEGLEDAVMRGAVSSAQERLYKRRMTASEELGNWEKWRELERTSGSIRLPTLMTTYIN